MTDPPRRHVDRVDPKKALSAPRSTKAEDARTAQEEQARLAAAAERRARDQAALAAEERRQQALELAEAAERELTLGRRIKRSSLANNVVTTSIAAVTALGTVTVWAVTRMQAAAQERAAEQHRREQITQDLESADEAIDKVAEDLTVYKRTQDEVNNEQGKVNTIQLLRGQRLEDMVELLLRDQGRKPPKRDELDEAECAAGVASPEECAVP